MSTTTTTTFPRDLTVAMESGYQPSKVEPGWNDWWESQGFYQADASKGAIASDDEKFIMVIPPPNVTGSLHLGHSLTNAIQDTLTRWHRMKGHVTLWVPGVDHAGIATQSVVERTLLKNEGLTRHDLGRETFVKRVWDWKEKNGDRICYQLRRLGVSVDWSRERFTMDPMLSTAVIEAFVRLFEMGLIYRETRLVSWCPHLKTALSEIEVDVEEIEKSSRVRVPGYQKTVEVGMLWYFKYPLHDDATKFIEVGTTRPETMLGDVAVAVNPKDPRYAEFVGKQLRHPFIADRKIFVIADEYVSADFGTGAVKITPAHDRNDFDIGKRHNLTSITVFTMDGKINDNGGCEFAGMHRFECRVEIMKRLQALGLVDREPTENKMQLPRCSRSNDIIEYMLIPQWWMNCKDAADRAVGAVRSGELDIVPSHHKQTWYHWLENIKDWCISRQLWWGHRIPAYRVIGAGGAAADKEVWVAGRNHEEALAKAVDITGNPNVTVEQDEDVLDTWFSSGLFAFSVFGWPEETADFKAFFPTTILETGHDIIFFWVARMVMMSYLLLDKLPFKTVLLHAMVRDAHGKKMSKSLGNVVDPIEAIEGISLKEMEDGIRSGNLPEKEINRAIDALKKDFPKGIPECGADALRYGLLAYCSQGRNINLDVNRVVGYRFFCNKLWNATKFALMNFPAEFVYSANHNDSIRNSKWADQWILHKLSMCSMTTNQALKEYSFGDAVTCTYNFWLYNFCDIYLELVKPRLGEGPDLDALNVIYTCLENGLKLLHPMMPFVTEELYQRLPRKQQQQNVATAPETISTKPYPEHEPLWQNSRLDDEMDLFMSVVKQFRSLHANLEVNPKERLVGYVKFVNDAAASSGEAFMKERLMDIAVLAKMEKVELVVVSEFPTGTVSDVVSERIQISLDPRGGVNLSQIVGKLGKKIDANEKAVESLIKKMSIENYENKVPEEIRAANSEKLLTLKAEGDAFKAAQGNVKSAIAAAGGAS